MDRRSSLRSLVVCVQHAFVSLTSGSTPPAGVYAPNAEAPAPGWLAKAERSIAAREYQAATSERGLQAPNRTHNLRTYFEPDGVRLHDRTADGDHELVRLRLTGVGRDAETQPVPAGQVVSEGARVEIRRPGLVEWYENKPEGLEQGFTITARPAGPGELRVALDLGSATAQRDGEALLLKTSSGRDLHYGALVVTDALGSVLPARFDLRHPASIEIAIDDRAAVYPLVVDPLVTATADARLEANQTGASGSAPQMGYSVAGAGDVNGDGYDDVIVGAPRYDSGETNEGAAFVFLGGPAGIANGSPSTAATLLQSDQSNALMGYSVAGAGDVNNDGYDDVIVGAESYTAGESSEGAAFVFLGGPTGVLNGSPASAAARLQSNQVIAHLGGSVAGAGDVNGDGYDDVIVGDGAYDLGQLNEGAAFIFMGGPAGILDGTPATAAATLQSDQAGGVMGNSVAAAGDVNNDGYDDVIVAAANYDAGEQDEGAVFVFLGSPSGIANGNPSTASAMLQANQVSAIMGNTVAGAGDVNGDGYDDVIVGAGQYTQDQAGEGAAFVFHGGPLGIASGNPATANTMLQSNQNGAFLDGVAGAGDVNGDGYDDVIVGAPDYDAGENNEGAAWVFLGGPSGVASGDPTTARATFQGNQAAVHLGVSVAGTGDINGDGYADVIVGGPYYDAGETDEGAAFVYLGGSVKGDLDNDFKTDLLLRHAPSGFNLTWLMNGTTRASEQYVTPNPLSLDQRVVGIHDFNHDMGNDLVLWNQVSGATEVWLMNGANRMGAAVPLAGALPPPWRLSATADFNHDSKPDLVWRNFTTQKIQIWTMNGMLQESTLVSTPDQAVDANWAIVATLDWNGDRNTDFLWYNATSGKIVLWFMNAAVQRTTGQFTNPPNAGDNNWNVVAAGDYGIGAGGLPGTKDIVWRNGTSGNLVVWHMDKAGNRTSGVFTTPMAPTPNPTDWTVVGPK